MKEYDVLFIHPPRVFENDFWKLGERACYMLVPMGLFGLTDLLNKEGFSTRMLNIPLEMYLQKDWTLEKFLKGVSARVYAISLHWVLNSYGAIEVAERCKKFDPNGKVVLGGFTSSYFDLEIMRNFPSVDGIIRGEAEQPILKLVGNLSKSETFDSIPNFTFRKNGEIARTPITYVANSLDHIDFTNVEPLHHWREYVKLTRKTMGIPFCVMVGRGCPFNCPFCGGGQRAGKIVSGRTTTLLRSPEKVVEDIARITRMANVESIYFGHGAYPQSLAYWRKLFSILREEKVDIGADLEIWRLPVDKAFIEDFSRTFNLDKSSLSLVLYPKRVRRLLAPLTDPLINYRDEDAQFLIENATARDVLLRLWLTVGNPFQTMKEVLEDLKFVVKLLLDRKMSGDPVSLYSTPVTVSPGSPAFQHPEKFGISLNHNSFLDFYQSFKREKFTFGELSSIINYRTQFLSARKMKFWNTVFSLLEVPFFLSSHH